MTAAKLPIGISDFQKIRAEGWYFIDKSLLIKNIIESPAEVLLIPRPRRFGKTLNLSMLRFFLETCDQDRSDLFHGLKISKDDDAVLHQGKYPVIWLTLKDVKHSGWQGCMAGIRAMIQKEFSRHRHLLESDALHPEEKSYFLKILSSELEDSAYERALYALSEWLHRFHNEMAVILIDEYDTPVHAAYDAGYYDRLIEFIRNFLSSGLKDNPHLFKGVLTGILRVAKESVFSGLNNLGVYTLLDREFNADFGFTDAEVRELLEHEGISNRYDDVAAWYNGYRFGGETLYNPWSVLHYVHRKPTFPSPYWVNTADSSRIDRLATRDGSDIREEIGYLLEGAAISKPVYDAIVMRDLEHQDDLIWSFLLYSGYLKPVEQIDFETWALKIPNREVAVVYRNFVRRWFSEKVETNWLEKLIQGLETSDITLFEKMLRRIVLQVMSFHDLGDAPERVYHALVLGMLVWMSGEYDIRSNRESGYGRYDLMLKPKDPIKPGIIIEFKKVDDYSPPDRTLEAAMEQIEAKHYAAELETAGIKNILKLAIAFKGKDLWIKHG
jgi:hypothetical protein